MTEKILTMDRPNPRQQEFLRCRKKYVAFGGARGGGKSWAVRTKAKLLALHYPGIRLLLVRRITEAHGGSMHIENPPEGGVCVSLTFRQTIRPH